ncbi:MAG: hypothetical protein IPK26_16690 [Planctomycetes bacterium]|nr:hypothetical protein [Planctomycetota bacterium]
MQHAAFCSVLLTSLTALAQAPSLHLQDDPTTSGYAGTSPRLLEGGSTPQLSIVGPVGHRVLLFAGTRLEPGIPLPGSTWPIHLAGFADVSSLLGSSGGVIREDHVPDGRGRLEVGVLMPLLPTPLQVALQAVVIAPNGALALTNPIEIYVTGGVVGAPAQVRFRLTASVVEEADEGGVLQVDATVTDAFGRLIRPTPALQFASNTPGTTMPTPTSFAFANYGSGNISVTLTGANISAATTIATVPEVVRGAFIDRVQRTAGLRQTGLDGLAALAAGNAAGVQAALAALSTGLQTGNLPPLTGQSLMMPLLRPYPTTQQLIASGAFPAGPNDAQMPALIATLTARFQSAANFLAGTPAGSLTFDQLAELGARYDELRNLVDQFEQLDFSGRAHWQNLQALQNLLEAVLPESLRQALEKGRQALDQARAIGDFAKTLASAYRSFGLGGLALRIYEPVLKDLGSLAGGMALNGLINWGLQNIANLNLCQACSTSCLAGCSGVVQNCSVELDGDGFSTNAADHRIIVVSISQYVTPIRNSFSGQDTIVDMLQAFANLNVLFPNFGGIFTPDSIGSQGLFCGNSAPLQVNSWPFRNTHPWGLPQPISVLVLRLDAGISNAFQWLQI